MDEKDKFWKSECFDKTLKEFRKQDEEEKEKLEQILKTLNELKDELKKTKNK